ncbi:uncharacterized protein FA14DRAFT_162238 [Meira miltonrushii]|uniref:Nucleotide-diphospho-sugar transferase n=1 Tax=Meira miltonrushii TaxID=1280837 RepID=A0A316V2U5_9BASI|nr:uncharacterized protein FA14DRAFT_162238 [Meira miltonrushii]PWN31876.1 hypothetical protein FA14DRAFT_162238 [Meira miltonrushii]
MSSIDVEKMPLTPIRRHRFNLRRIIILILSLLVMHRIILLLFDTKPPGKQHIEVQTDRGYGELYKLSWQSLTQALNTARPKVATIGDFKSVPGIPVESVESTTAIDALNVEPHIVSSLQGSHASFTKILKEEDRLSVIYQSGQQGIVVTATLHELPQLLISLRLLRRTRSSLPVEVFLLTQDDYDSKLCREIFPKLDAHCSILEEHLDSSPLPTMPQSRNERKIQAQEPLNKLLAVFFSRFEDVLVLDPSTLVYNNPDIMLKEEPFLSTGLLIWPDFWASTVSPKLFTIQNAPQVKRNRRDNIRTVDFGQMVISKSIHSATLLLSIYYTYFGPNLYDSLQQQSSAGERGSQAIKCAARYLETPYYMMKRQVEAVGFPDLDSDNKGFYGVAMLQAFASDDFHRLPKDRQRPLFIRQNNPTLHPAYVMDRNIAVFKKQPSTEKVEESKAKADSDPSKIMQKVKAAAPAGDSIKKDQSNPFAIPSVAPTDADRGLHHRMWEWFGGRYMSNGWRDPDPERALWEEVATVACVDYTHFRVWPSRDNKETTENCARINYHRGQLGWKEFFVL